MTIRSKHLAAALALGVVAVSSTASADPETVSDTQGLLDAIAAGKTPITLQKGDYPLTATLTLGNINLVGATENPRDVVIYSPNHDIRIVNFNGSTTGSLYNLTVSNGCFTAAGGGYSTAGVSGSSANILSNCVVTACEIAVNGTKAAYGAGVFGCTLYDCKVVGNVAPNSKNCQGGGIASCRAYDTEIFGNSAYLGGGAYNATLYRCLVHGNASDTNGGGLYLCTTYDSVISNNTAKTNGGGVYQGTHYDAIVTHNRSIGTGSGSGYGGGAREGTFYRSVIKGNYGNSYAGGVQGSTLYDCWVRDNASSGYATAMQDGKAYNCVFSNNVCNGSTVRGALRYVTASNCTFYGTSVDYSGAFTSCQFLNLQEKWYLPPGANVAAEGSFTPSGYIYLGTGQDTKTSCFAATNCLFAGNWCTSYMFAKAKLEKVQLVNCTIVDNHAPCIMRLAGSNMDGAADSEMINCAFPRNYGKGSWSRLDFRVDEGVTHLNLTNCLFGPYKQNVGPAAETASVNDVADMKFDTSNAEYPYSLKRKSPAVGMGLYQDWMATATDQKGDPRAHLGDPNTVAIGCYECWLSPRGLCIIYR